MHHPCSVDELVCVRTRWLAPSTRPWQNKARTTADERPYGLQRRCYNAVAFASISADNHSTTLPARQVALHLAARFATHTFSRLEQGSGSRQRRVRGRRCHATARFLHHTRSRMRSCVALRYVALRYAVPETAAQLVATWAPPAARNRSPGHERHRYPAN